MNQLYTAFVFISNDLPAAPGAAVLHVSVIDSLSITHI
jgi:hypothetical protein